MVVRMVRGHDVRAIAHGPGTRPATKTGSLWQFTTNSHASVMGTGGTVECFVKSASDMLGSSLAMA